MGSQRRVLQTSETKVFALRTEVGFSPLCAVECEILMHDVRRPTTLVNLAVRGSNPLEGNAFIVQLGRTLDLV